MQTPVQATPAFNIYSLSESALTITFGNDIGEKTRQQLSDFNLLLLENPFPGFLSSVPAYTTVSVFYDPVTVISTDQMAGLDCLERVSGFLEALHDKVRISEPISDKTMTIPVCYGQDFGPDIQEVAQKNKLTIQQVIEIHSKAVYTVYMIGFMPGFAYLGGMDERIATARKPTPAKAVSAGAVGIAGKQTGVYPLQSPGGWQIIGQTPLNLFDAYRPQPALLKAGDKVVFKPIDKPEFDVIKNG